MSDDHMKLHAKGAWSRSLLTQLIDLELSILRWRQKHTSWELQLSHGERDGALSLIEVPCLTKGGSSGLYWENLAEAIIKLSFFAVCFSGHGEARVNQK